MKLRKSTSKLILTEKDYKKFIRNLALKKMGYNRATRRKLLKEDYDPLEMALSPDIPYEQREFFEGIKVDDYKKLLEKFKSDGEYDADLELSSFNIFGVTVPKDQIFDPARLSSSKKLEISKRFANLSMPITNVKLYNRIINRVIPGALAAKGYTDSKKLSGYVMFYNLLFNYIKNDDRGLTFTKTLLGLHDEITDSLEEELAFAGVDFATGLGLEKAGSVMVAKRALNNAISANKGAVKKVSELSKETINSATTRATQTKAGRAEILRDDVKIVDDLKKTIDGTTAKTTAGSPDDPIIGIRLSDNETNTLIRQIQKWCAGNLTDTDLTLVRTLFLKMLSASKESVIEGLKFNLNKSIRTKIYLDILEMSKSNTSIVIPELSSIDNIMAAWKLTPRGKGQAFQNNKIWKKAFEGIEMSSLGREADGIVTYLNTIAKKQKEGIAAHAEEMAYATPNPGSISAITVWGDFKWSELVPKVDKFVKDKVSEITDIDVKIEKLIVDLENFKNTSSDEINGAADVFFGKSTDSNKMPSLLKELFVESLKDMVLSARDLRLLKKLQSETSAWKKFWSNTNKVKKTIGDSNKKVKNLAEEKIETHLIDALSGKGQKLPSFNPSTSYQPVLGSTDTLTNTIRDVWKNFSEYGVWESLSKSMKAFIAPIIDSFGMNLIRYVSVMHFHKNLHIALSTLRKNDEFISGLLSPQHLDSALARHAQKNKGKLSKKQKVGKALIDDADDISQGIIDFLSSNDLSRKLDDVLELFERATTVDNINSAKDALGDAIGLLGPKPDGCGLFESISDAKKVWFENSINLQKKYFPDGIGEIFATKAVKEDGSVDLSKLFGEQGLSIGKSINGLEKILNESNVADSVKAKIQRRQAKLLEAQTTDDYISAKEGFSLADSQYEQLANMDISNLADTKLERYQKSLDMARKALAKAKSDLNTLNPMKNDATKAGFQELYTDILSELSLIDSTKSMKTVAKVFNENKQKIKSAVQSPELGERLPRYWRRWCLWSDLGEEFGQYFGSPPSPGLIEEDKLKDIVKEIASLEIEVENRIANLYAAKVEDELKVMRSKKDMYGFDRGEVEITNPAFRRYRDFELNNIYGNVGQWVGWVRKAIQDKKTVSRKIIIDLPFIPTGPKAEDKPKYKGRFTVSLECEGSKYRDVKDFQENGFKTVRQHVKIKLGMGKEHANKGFLFPRTIKTTAANNPYMNQRIAEFGQYVKNAEKTFYGTLYHGFMTDADDLSAQGEVGEINLARSIYRANNNSTKKLFSTLDQTSKLFLRAGDDFESDIASSYLNPAGQASFGEDIGLPNNHVDIPMILSNTLDGQLEDSWKKYEEIERDEAIKSILDEYEKIGSSPAIENNKKKVINLKGNKYIGHAYSGTRANLIARFMEKFIKEIKITIANYAFETAKKKKEKKAWFERQKDTIGDLWKSKNKKMTKDALETLMKYEIEKESKDLQKELLKKIDLSNKSSAMYKVLEDATEKAGIKNIKLTKRQIEYLAKSMIDPALTRKFTQHIDKFAIKRLYAIEITQNEANIEKMYRKYLKDILGMKDRDIDAFKLLLAMNKIDLYAHSKKKSKNRKVFGDTSYPILSDPDFIIKLGKSYSNLREFILEKYPDIQQADDWEGQLKKGIELMLLGVRHVGPTGENFDKDSYKSGYDEIINLLKQAKYDQSEYDLVFPEYGRARSIQISDIEKDKVKAWLKDDKLKENRKKILIKESYLRKIINNKIIKKKLNKNLLNEGEIFDKWKNIKNHFANIANPASIKFQNRNLYFQNNSNESTYNNNAYFGRVFIGALDFNTKTNKVKIIDIVEIPAGISRTYTWKSATSTIDTGTLVDANTMLNNEESFTGAMQDLIPPTSNEAGANINDTKSAYVLIREVAPHITVEFSGGAFTLKGKKSTDFGEKDIIPKTYTSAELISDLKAKEISFDIAIQSYEDLFSSLNSIKAEKGNLLISSVPSSLAEDTEIKFDETFQASNTIKILNNKIGKTVTVSDPGEIAGQINLNQLVDISKVLLTLGRNNKEINLELTIKFGEEDDTKAYKTTLPFRGNNTITAGRKNDLNITQITTTVTDASTGGESAYYLYLKGQVLFNTILASLKVNEHFKSKINNTPNLSTITSGNEFYESLYSDGKIEVHDMRTAAGRKDAKEKKKREKQSKKAFEAERKNPLTKEQLALEDNYLQIILSSAQVETTTDGKTTKKTIYKIQVGISKDKIVYLAGIKPEIEMKKEELPDLGADKIDLLSADQMGVSESQKELYRFVTEKALKLSFSPRLPSFDIEDWVKSLIPDGTSPDQEKLYRVIDKRSKASAAFDTGLGIFKDWKKDFDTAMAGYGSDFDDQTSRLEFIRRHGAKSPFAEKTSTPNKPGAYNSKIIKAANGVYHPRGYDPKRHERKKHAVFIEDNVHASLNIFYLQLYVLLCLRKYGEFGGRNGTTISDYKEYDLYKWGWDPESVGNKNGIIDDTLKNTGNINGAIDSILEATWNKSKGPFRFDAIRDAYSSARDEGRGGSGYISWKTFSDNIIMNWQDKNKYASIGNKPLPIGYLLGADGNPSTVNVGTFIHDVYHDFRPDEQGSAARFKFDKRSMAQINKDLRIDIVKSDPEFTERPDNETLWDTMKEEKAFASDEKLILSENLFKIFVNKIIKGIK
jgi:hypothetical protein